MDGAQSQDSVQHTEVGKILLDSLLLFPLLLELRSHTCYDPVKIYNENLTKATEIFQVYLLMPENVTPFLID